MGQSPKSSGYGLALYSAVIFLLAGYFVFATVQGNFGLFERIQIQAEADTLRKQRDMLKSDVELMRNKTLRLSDNYLDLDLLDEQARDILGLVRMDELVIR